MARGQNGNSQGLLFGPRSVQPVVLDESARNIFAFASEYKRPFPFKDVIRQNFFAKDEPFLDVLALSKPLINGQTDQYGVYHHVRVESMVIAFEQNGEQEFRGGIRYHKSSPNSERSVWIPSETGSLQEVLSQIAAHMDKRYGKRWTRPESSYVPLTKQEVIRQLELRTK